MSWSWILLGVSWAVFAYVMYRIMQHSWQISNELHDAEMRAASDAAKKKKAEKALETTKVVLDEIRSTDPELTVRERMRRRADGAPAPD